MTEPQIMTGVILPKGELRIDGPIDHPPGRVRVFVTECPPDSDDDGPWSRLESEWRAQRVRYHQVSENAAMKASKEAQPQETPAAETLTPAAADLRDGMSQLSEDCYCAGWLGDLEFLLWTAVMNGPVHQGSWNITQSDIDRLRLLARRCGGWIVWDEVRRAEVWMPIDEWLRQYDRFVANRA